MDLFIKLKKKFKEGNIVTSLIYINVGVFIVTAFINLVVYLFNLPPYSILDYGKLPASLTVLAHRPWTLITYMFLHQDILHILFNMLFLYWFGNFFYSLFTTRHLRGVYVLGGIMGAIFFIVSYHIFPKLLLSVDYVSLIGASASILAIVTAVATRVPNQSVRFLLIGSIKLKYVALIVILLDMLMISIDNPGGHIAHLGGALAGYLFVKALSRGTDLTKWINAIIDIPQAIISYFKSRKQRMKVVKNNKKYTKHKQDHDYNYKKKQQLDEVDRILDKIKESGYNNLTEDEKKALFNAGKK